MRIDLQLHSTYSDGYLTPTQLVEYIHKQGVKVAALTDHNTVSGIGEFNSVCRQKGIKFIPGLELYAKLGNARFNLLWYNFDHRQPALHDMLRESQVRRRSRMRAMLEKLQRRKIIIDCNKVLDKHNHYVPLNHVVDEIVANPGNMARMRKETGLKNPREEDVIGKYFMNKESGYFRESYINIERIMKVRHKIGGQLILNHPAKGRYIQKEFIAKLVKMGMDGLEKLSPHHSVSAVMYIQHLANELNLIETGGSDFHRFEGFGRLVQSAADYFRIESIHLKDIKKVIK